MSSYILDNFDMLSKHHYIRRAGASDYWFDFTQGRLKEYRSEFGDDFCLILYASDTEDDSYVLPYSQVKHLLKDEYLDERQRWIGSISNNLLRIRRSNQSMSISAYYNDFEPLEEEANDGPTLLNEPEVLYDVGEEIKLTNLTQHIQAINERYRQAIPRKQKRVSEYVARPNAITDYLKRFRDFICQICGEKGFIQRNGSPYIETHHIIELHKLIPGSLCSDNVVVVCANCHRRFHYAHIVYKTANSNLVSVEINGEHFTFERNVVSQSV
jgi:5-methylcytosine-specific restriction endonuclease McrA